MIKRTPALSPLLILILCAPLAACGDEDGESITPDASVMGTPLELVLPEGFPSPVIPEDNPLTEEKVELGRKLFYDRRLSGNETQSCGDCHKQEHAFTDGLPRAIGSTEEMHPRAAMGLTNVAYHPVLGWGNPQLESLEEQAPVPMFGETPVELGLAGRDDEVLARLAADPDYPTLFEVSFPESADPINFENIVKAISSFERTLLSGNSPFDRFRYHAEPEAMSASARRGLQLFFDERFECFHCHGGFNFTDSTTFAGAAFEETPFHNNGLYNVGSNGDYPSPNQGLFDFTQDPADRGKFKAPTLRNIALTAPYMHDGSIETLEDVIEHYARGGRLIEDGELAGDGKENPNKDQQFLRGFEATAQEKADLVAFLEALTDLEFVNDPAFSNPWE